MSKERSLFILIAEKSGYSRSWVSKVMRGKANPTVRCFKRVMKAAKQIEGEMCK